MRPEFLITGGRGQLGSELARQFGRRAVALGFDGLDVTNREQVLRTIQASRPRAVIHTAAWTDVERAEIEPELCFRVNTDAPRYLAEACADIGAILVQLSTDYVFGQENARAAPYRSTDATGPINVYGLSKAASETAVRACPRHYVVRTCGLYTSPANEKPFRSFVLAMLLKSRQQARIPVVHDQRCSPSYVPHVASALVQLLRHEPPWGTYHLVNPGAVSWYEFATHILQFAGSSAVAEPIESSQFPSTARRPAYSVLHPSSDTECPGLTLPDWKEALLGCLQP